MSVRSSGMTRDVKGEAEDRSRRGKGIGDSLRRRARKVGWDGT